MPYAPGVSYFIRFYELDPSEQNRCIYFTQKGGMCKWNCRDEDNQRAVLLQRAIMNSCLETMNIELLREYVQCNCCVRARYQNRIEDVELLTPLAQRWLNEIRTRAAHCLGNEMSISSLQQGKTHDYACNIPNTSSPDTRDELFSANVYLAPAPKSQRRLAPIEASSMIKSSHPHPLSSSSNTSELALHSGENHPRYKLRIPQTNRPGETNIIQPSYSFQVSLSEFRPHIVELSLSGSVYNKMLDPLEDRDFDTGTVYTLDRGSSLGHLKIGWTAKAVSVRLKAWSNCGYDLNLLFHMGGVPYAQRLETLTHHELIKEWRRERRCKAPWCGKSHQVWFEINKEKAEQVLGDWANFISEAKPYESTGCLKTYWKEAIAKIERKMKGITAKELLNCNESTLIDELRVSKEPVRFSCEPKIVEMSSEDTRGTRSKISKQGLVCVRLPETEHPSSPNPMSSLKSESSCKEHKRDRFIESKPLRKVKLSHEDVPTLAIATIKKEFAPEDIPLPPSPIPETASLQDPATDTTSSTLETKNEV
ncbi:hypothetical protein N7508_006500 [Penicillium antarcticum]|uniref:uncharacterized protein n=1 Tax=Penicillium antarcticum TaxID=416450 RepID=UPI002384124C|nr:uncharacterized protein N7508_006500 [Penicillium antarcticum]KAJ5301637.1 hypothetical protein N7508_006500 [Penicillium antarcticum]